MQYFIWSVPARDVTYTKKKAFADTVNSDLYTPFGEICDAVGDRNVALTTTPIESGTVSNTAHIAASLSCKYLSGSNRIFSEVGKSAHPYSWVFKVGIILN